ncbi:hypothetical protein FOZ62_026644 [Perkinsus olseni]|uniref:RRM domain-containing protein n=1 Tax=Perkinsus olseni TaxID=32597 RepID=A0A7J6TT66_PEROL|nr:hypothetical protein FOZ62_026644 [Perkinsus olseni]
MTIAAAVESDDGKRRKVTCGGTFLRLPLEVLSAKFKSDRKDIERDLLLIHNFISSGKVAAAANPAEAVEKLLKKLDIVEGRVSEKKREQASLADTIKRRVTVMENITSASDVDDLVDWGDPDTLLLMEWLVRNGFSRTLTKLMETSQEDSLIGQGALLRESLDPDIAVDEKIRGIKKALRNGDVAPAIEWYKSCRSRIDKMHKTTRKEDSTAEVPRLVRGPWARPTLEDEKNDEHQQSREMDLLTVLHLYEVTRLLEGSDEGRFERAVEYVRKGAEDGDIAGPNLGVACRAVSCGIRGAHEHGVGDDTAAFWCIQGRSSSDAREDPQRLFDARLEAASNLLADYTRFVYYNDDISSTAVSDTGSMMERLVRAGVFALATPTCPSNASASCPCCDPLCFSWGFQQGMEHPTRLRSHLVCPYTGRIMEQARASPAGHVLSSHCMSLLSKGNGDSSSRSGEHVRKIRCPVTGVERMEAKASLPEICPTISSDSSSEIARKDTVVPWRRGGGWYGNVDCDLDCQLYNTFLHFGGPSEPAVPEPEEQSTFRRRPRSLSCTRFQREPRRSSYKVGSEDDETPTDDSSNLDGNEKQFTTVMVHNLQSHCNIDYFQRVLDAAGFRGFYDFLYVPLNFKTREVVGFAFVNFGDQEHAQKMIDGFNDLVLDGCLPLVVEAAKNQGLQAQIDHLRESPVNAAEEEFRPKLFELGTGHQLEFPAPTNPRPPRRSHRHRRRVREYVPQKPKPVEVCDPYAQTHLDYSMALGDLLL